MPFVTFVTLNGDRLGLNVAEITLFCTVKKGTRIFLKDGVYNDVQEDFDRVSEILNSSLISAKN